MTAVPFDTLKLARTLQAQGAFSDAQSSRLVEALGDILASDLVTKPDLREAELRLETRIAEAKAETIKWFFGVVGIQTLAIIGAVVAVTRSLH